MQSKKQRFFNGRMVAIVRGLRGKSGEAVITVKADNLPELTIPVQVEADGPEE